MDFLYSKCYLRQADASFHTQACSRFDESAWTGLFIRGQLKVLGEADFIQMKKGCGHRQAL